MADRGLFGGVFGRGDVDTGDQAWLMAMLHTEAALARALERAGLAPEGTGAAVTEAAAAATVDMADLGRQAAVTGNPVPALVRALAQRVPADAAAAVHQGATSQDIIDTAAMLLARHALAAVAADLAAAADATAGLAAGHRDTVMIGRTLLQQAVPVTFGLVAAGWLTGMDEARAGLDRVRSGRLAVQFGGAAGTLSSLGADGPRVARLLAEELGLPLPVLPWHTDRLRIVEVAASCAGAAATLGKIARDVTLLAQSEVAEVHEAGPVARAGPEAARDAGEQAGAPGQAAAAGPAGAPDQAGSPGRGGSSAMPHKRNPVAAIAILGCTRQVPGLLATLTAAAEQEYQRAAGAWHSEWQPYADLLRLTGSAASWGVELLAGLTVDAARMRANLDAAGGFPLAERVSGLLAPAVGAIAAHDLVARASAQAAVGQMSLRDALLGIPAVRRWIDQAEISTAQIDAALDPAAYLGAAGEFTDAALAAHASSYSPRSDQTARSAIGR
ncbi:MAG TPA: lyase family protein [Streptosporangiaceae bacterium]|nr:lyase family protein [Streptosporangiaceae bacterium]